MGQNESQSSQHLTRQNKMVTIEKTIWPPPMGASLTAKGEDGKIMIVIPCKPKSVSRWMGKRVTKAERLRVEKALVNLSAAEHT